MPTSRDRYLVGLLGAYDVSTVARIDHHIHSLRIYRYASRRRADQARHDVDLLLERRLVLTARVPA